MSAAAFVLYKCDLTRSSTLNHHNTVCLFESAKKKQQKLVIGDESGRVQCVEVKDRIAKNVWKGKEDIRGQRDVTGMLTHSDRVYVAYGTTLAGYLKKTSHKWFSASTQSTEDVLHLALPTQASTSSSTHYIPTIIYTATEHSVSSFILPTKDRPSMPAGDVYYQAEARIGALTTVNLSANHRDPDLCVLGTEDRQLHVIHDNASVAQHRVNGAVSALSTIHYAETSNNKKYGLGSSASNLILYGTQSGEVGCVALTPSLSSVCEITPVFVLPNTEHRQAISVLCLATLTTSAKETGMKDICVGRDDGHLEIYTYDSVHGNITEDISPVFVYSAASAIMSLCAGCVHTPNVDDLVVGTYTGDIISIGHNTEKVQVYGKTEVKDVQEKNKYTVALNQDIQGLQQKVQAYKDKYNKIQINTETAAPVNTNTAPPSVPFENINNLPIKSSFRLLPTEHCYLLSLEIPCMIDLCILHLPCAMSLLDFNNNTQAIVSKSGTESRRSSMGNGSTSPSSSSTSGGGAGSESIVVFRMVENVSRIEVKLQTVEGEFGLLSAYILPRSVGSNSANPSLVASATSPAPSITTPGSVDFPRMANKVQLNVKPLSLHEKQDKSCLTERNSNKLSTLTITGNFSMTDIHTWLSQCLPSLVPHTTETEASLYYSQVQLGTILCCYYKKNSVRLESDHLSVISILKEFISKEATNKKIIIQMNFLLNPFTIECFLTSIQPRLDHHFTIAYKYSLINALLELQQHEGSNLYDYLDVNYIEILQQYEQIRKDFLNSPKELMALKQILMDLFLDKYKLQGRDVSRQMHKLTEVFEEYEFSKLVAVFA